jgi:hypothetical protein
MRLFYPRNPSPIVSLKSLIANFCIGIVQILIKGVGVLCLIQPKKSKADLSERSAHLCSSIYIRRKTISTQ